MRSGYRRFIIIIIATTPFEVEGREVGCPTVYEVYMVRFMMGIWYGIWYGIRWAYGMVYDDYMVRYMVWFMKCIWYGL